MRPPHLLLLGRLIEPSRNALNQLAEIRAKLAATVAESIELRGFSVMVISILESMLTETYVYYLSWFPEAFDFRDVKFSKEDILSANLALDLIGLQVEKTAVSQAYESFPDLLKTFTKTLGIADLPLDETRIDKVIEFKETRNLLLHNNLRVNRRYLAKVRQLRRGDLGTRLPLSREYVEDCCEAIQALIQELQDRMKDKYASFTRLAALRKLWEYLFSSPIMPFDDYWIVDEPNDKVVAIKEGPMEKVISKSERLFLSVWRAHFNGWTDPGGHMLMYSLDSKNKQKMLWLLATLVDFNVR